MRALVVALCVIGVVGSSVPSNAQPRSRVVVDGLEFPAGVAFLPDRTMVVTERPGRVRLVRDGALVAEPLAEIPTTTAGETGLLGVAVPPDLDSDPAVYVFATEPDGSTNSVWRVPLDGSAPTRVVEGLPAATYHNGGGVTFGDDGKLYVSNGEQHDSGRARDPQVLGGKIYRFEPDGSIPEDNPYEGSPTFASGFRNPFGITVDPEDGTVWVTENGPESFDEINRVTAEADHGWPDVSGPGCDQDCVDPVLAYRSIIVPTGLVFAGKGAPERFTGDLFFGAYGEQTIHRVQLDDQRTEAVADEVFERVNEPVIAVAWGPRGLYYSTPTDIRLLALRGSAQADDEEESASPEPSPAVSERPEGSSDTDDRNPPWGLLVLALLLGSLVLMRSRTTRRLDEDHRQDPKA